MLASMNGTDTTNENAEYITPDEAAALCGLSAATIRRMLRDGRIRGQQLPQNTRPGPRRWWRVLREDVEQLWRPVERATPPPASPPPRPASIVQQLRERAATEDGLRRHGLD